jgi:hypothetical protein
MNRRTFLKSIATTAAIATCAPLALFVKPQPPESRLSWDQNGILVEMANCHISDNGDAYHSDGYGCGCQNNPKGNLYAA